MTWHDMMLTDARFRAAKITSFVAAAAFSAVFLVIWPCSMLSGQGIPLLTVVTPDLCNLCPVDILDSGGFLVWTTLSRGWAFTAAAFIILAPLLQVTNTMHLKLELSTNLREISRSPMDCSIYSV